MQGDGGGTADGVAEGEGVRLNIDDSSEDIGVQVGGSGVNGQAADGISHGTNGVADRDCRVPGVKRQAEPFGGVIDIADVDRRVHAHARGIRGDRDDAVVVGPVLRQLDGPGDSGEIDGPGIGFANG